MKEKNEKSLLCEKLASTSICYTNARIKKPMKRELKHAQVCGFIRQWIDDNMFNHICNEMHARSLWEKLESLYARKTGNNKLFLIKKIINLH